jgi:transcriptional regulator with XRE-family HTH domain
MSEKSALISRLKNDKSYRAAYIRAKINVNVPSQIRALRLKSPMTQEELADAAGMKQPRISAMERPGETQFNLDTLIRLAAAFKVGLIVRFASHNEMLRWENEFSQDAFDVVPLGEDSEFQAEERPANEPFIARTFGDYASTFRANAQQGVCITTTRPFVHMPQPQQSDDFVVQRSQLNA